MHKLKTIRRGGGWLFKQVKSCCVHMLQNTRRQTIVSRFREYFVTYTVWFCEKYTTSLTVLVVN